MIYLTLVPIAFAWGFVVGAKYQESLMRPLVDLSKKHSDEWFGKYMDLLRKPL